MLQSTSAEGEGTDELEEEELEVLREAGVIAPASKKGRRKARSKRGKHILFADDEDEGVWRAACLPIPGTLTSRLPTAAQQRAASARQGPSSSDSQHDGRLGKSVILSVDMGWKAPEEAKRKRRKSKAAEEDESMALDEESPEGAETAKVCTLSSALDVRPLTPG